MAGFPEPTCGSFDGPVHRYAVRAEFEDTDVTGVVYHANYLRWFERARSDMVRLLGIDQRAAHAAGEGAYAVSDLSIRYRVPARFDDVVLIESRASELRGASCLIMQRAFRRDYDSVGVVLAEASVRVAFVGPNGRPRRQPEAWRKAFARVAGPDAEPHFTSQDTR